jgi:hypothetical protein
MTFRIISGVFKSFASASDVTGRDPRFFEANEGVTTADIESALEQSSQRILTQIRNTDWWANYQFSRNTALNRDVRLLPVVDPLYILAREQEFKDLNVQFALLEYLYPSRADFGDETSAEVKKIAFYLDLYNKLFIEVIQAGDFYDFSKSGTITTDEKAPGWTNRVRVR